MTNESAWPFGGLLRRLRADAGMTQEQLAQAAQVSARSVSDLERGINMTARRETARLLADALGLSGAIRRDFEVAAQRGMIRSPQSMPPSPPTGVAAATRTLPRDVASFTGREPELRRLTETAAEAAVSGGTVSIFAIGGMAGVGKTALAVHAAHTMAGIFPDGQIFVRMHGHTPMALL